MAAIMHRVSTLTALLCAVSALLRCSAMTDCSGGSCQNAALSSVHHHRTLYQALPAAPGWGGVQTCGSQTIVVAYASTKPDIGSLASELESTLTNVAIGTHESFQVVVNDKNVGYVSLTDPTSCIRTLSRVRGGLVVYDDGNIPNLSALANLRSVDGPFIIYGNANASLTSLAGLEGLQTVAHLNLAHTKLQSLAGLSGLSIINGDLIVWDNSNLTSLQGLGRITQLYGKLWIDTNPLLQDMTGLESLTAAFDDAVFVDCPRLRSLQGLNGVTKFGQDFVLRNLKSLTTTAALANLTTVGESVILMNLPRLQDITALRNLQAVNTDLQLWLLPNVPDLTALSNLQSVKLNLVVGGMAQIKNLQGLNKLRSIGLLLSVGFNQQLESLQGLNSLQSIGQDIAIRGNAELTTLAGLTTSLRSIGAYRGSDIFIEDNPKLADLAGLEGPGIPIYGSVTVQGNSPNLPEASVNALKAKAVPVPNTIETLMRGLPANVTTPAAAAQTATPANAAAAAAAGPGANGSVGAAAPAGDNSSLVYVGNKSGAAVASGK